MTQPSLHNKVNDAKVKAELRAQLAPAYRQTLQSNPYKILREHKKLTQEDAAKLAGLSVQYIYRIENGLVATPSFNLASVLYDDPTTMKARLTVERYHDWVHSMRDIVKTATYGMNALDGPYRNVSALSDEHPFYNYMFNFNMFVGPILEIKQDLRSQQLFNRLLCLHPRSVQQFLKSHTGRMAPSLVSALNDVGQYTRTVSTLEDTSRGWLMRRGDYGVAR